MQSWPRSVSVIRPLPSIQGFHFSRYPQSFLDCCLPDARGISFECALYAIGHQFSKNESFLQMPSLCPKRSFHLWTWSQTSVPGSSCVLVQRQFGWALSLLFISVSVAQEPLPCLPPLATCRNKWKQSVVPLRTVKRDINTHHDTCHSPSHVFCTGFLPLPAVLFLGYFQDSDGTPPTAHPAGDICQVWRGLSLSPIIPSPRQSLVTLHFLRCSFRSYLSQAT